ncbi:MAG: hypothetical protein LIP77_01300, partial [Planctomycetes bacterium]|nr:hypothetical protein [Planctomycetota bacterium]
DLQFNRSSEYAAYLQGRIFDLVQRAPRRGRIIDADNNIIAEDQPTQDLWVVPARYERIDRRRVVVSNLVPLSADQMVSLAASRGDRREFEYRVALAALVDANPLVAELARRLDRTPEEIARRLLAAITAGPAGSTIDLLEARPAVGDVDFSLAMEIRSAIANPFDQGVWRPLQVRTGGKRFYPAGSLLGHLTGTVGKLTAEEYAQLRGSWNGDEVTAGEGQIVKQGRVFFSLRDGDGPDGTDEEHILRLRTVKRSGRMVRSTSYLANDIVGRGGLEQHYNQALRGRHRQQVLRLVRDARTGRRQQRPRDGHERAVDGSDVRLSLRLDTQRQATEIMERHIARIARRPELQAYGWTPSGVAIIMNPHNGRIHALVSLPTYDPNTFSRDFDDLVQDPANPLLDRALAGIYPPGSVVKPLVGLAALSEEKVMPGQRFHCDRVMLLAGARFTCLGRHGDVDLVPALMHSCNTYFYHAGEALGSRSLYEWYTRAGLGHRTGIDVAGEVNGIIPRTAYTRQGWATGNTYHMAIGQGIAVTPLQVAVLFSLLANAEGGVGKVVRPHLLIPPTHVPNGPIEEELAREALLLDQPVAELMVDREALATVRQGLWEVVQGNPETMSHGTGMGASFPAPGGGWLMEVAGKTGTAEWSRVVDGRVRKQPDHVWFAAYAPFDRPEVVVVVLLPEAGGGGGTLCAPIAKDLLRLWFNLPERPERIAEEGALG